MKIIIVIALIFIICKVINSKKSSISSSRDSSSTIMLTPPEQAKIIKSFYDCNNHLQIKDCQSYYKALRECYEKYGNEMFSLNVMKGFLYGYDINEYMGITVEDVQKDLEKIARGEPDSNLSSPSADSLISLLESWDRHENLMEITDLDSYYRALREYYAKYRNSMFKLDIIIRFLRTYQLDKKVNKSARDIQKDIETIANGDELPNEKLPIYKTKRWREIKSDFPDIYDAESYLDILEYFYLEYCNYMFDKDVINEFIRIYQLDTRFQIGYKDVIKDLHKMDKRFKAEIAEEHAKKNRWLRWETMERENRIISDYESYKKVLKQYYLEYGKNISTVDFVNYYKLKSRFNIDFMDVGKDLDELEETGNIIPKQTQCEQPQSINDTSPVQEQRVQSQTVNTTPPQPNKGSNPHRILICDDAVYMRMVLKNILTQNGYKVIAEAQNGLEAIERYCEFKPDLVFMDITMPTMDGIDATIKIREIDRRANIVMCSAIGQQELVMEAIRSGAKDFIEKPFAKEAVLQAVVKIFEPWRIATPPEETEQSQTVNTTPPVQAQRTELNGYQNLLEEYYRKYKDQVFQNRILSEIQQKISFEKSLPEIKHDMKILRNEIILLDETATLSTQSQTTSTTPPVQEQNKQNQNASNTFAEHNESFYSYVTHMSNTQLINTIDGQYKSIKGTWNVAPCMGEYGSIEYSAVLLLWRYAMANFYRNQEAFISLQITLGDIIGCSFFGMPAGEWSDKVDPILNSHADILTYDEFGDVYNYLKDHLMDKIRSLEFNRGNMKDAESRQLYARFTQIYNSMSGYPETFDFYTSKGLNLEKDIHSLDEYAAASLISQNWKWGDKDFMEAVFAFLSSQKWELCSRDLVENTYVDIPSRLTDNFYSSSYVCPTCGRHMYKTVFPIGAESPIKIDKEIVLMKRIFTCPTCRTFYTPLSGHKLSHGQCYCLESRTQYDLLLKIYDNQGTTDGRSDA